MNSGFVNKQRCPDLSTLGICQPVFENILLHTCYLYVLIYYLIFCFVP